VNRSITSLQCRGTPFPLRLKFCLCLYLSFTLENHIGPIGLEFIAESLQTNAVLQHLDLEGIPHQTIKHGPISNLPLGNQTGSDGMLALADGLAANKTLLEINLTSNSVDMKGILLLRNLFGSNSTLRKLILSSTTKTILFKHSISKLTSTLPL